MFKNTKTVTFSTTQLFVNCARALDAFKSLNNPGDLLTTIIFAVVALEGFINELGEVATLNPDEESIRCFADIMREMSNQQERLLIKYRFAYFAFTGKTCPIGQEPWQSFKMLIDLRNEIVHHHAHTVEPDATEPPRVIKSLESKNLIPKRPVDATPLSIRINNPKVAAWAHKTAIDVRSEMFSIIPKSGFKDSSLYLSGLKPEDK